MANNNSNDKIKKVFESFKVHAVYVDKSGKVSLSPKIGYNKLTKDEFAKKLSKNEKIVSNE